MEDFTLFDGGVAAILFISAVLAYSRGFVREALSIAGWIGAGIVAFYFSPQVVPLVQEIPILADIIGDNCELGILAAFAGVFAIALVIIALFTPLISGAVQKSALGSLDGGLGFLFGLARGVLLIVVALVAYDFFIAGSEGFPVVEDSKTRVILAEQQTRMQEYIPTDIPEWLIEPYEQLTASCTGDAVTEEEAATSAEG
ncbi:colicin V production CvpA [Rhodobacterales bacterium 52_120_T64]|nr:colicin V production CvpA [Rhodobacterales bacterium 52_120_T64]